MNYIGSKIKLAKELLSIILKDRINEPYIEPFCGGCNLIDKIDGIRIANDSHFYLIEMMKALVYQNWQPPDTISFDLYKEIRENKNNYKPELVGFVGFTCSFSAKWFASFARDKQGNRNHCDEGRRHLLKQAKNLYGVSFLNLNYTELYIPDNSIVYCDPPYINTFDYKSNFNHDSFWQWCRDLSQRCKVYISESIAPDDFICIWEKNKTVNINKITKSYIRSEKLFIHSSQN